MFILPTRLVIFLFVLCSAICLNAVPGFAKNRIRAGVARTDITPPLGTPLRGYYVERLASAVHDPLFAKALVIQDGQNTIVLVFLDLIDVPEIAVKKARAEIAAKFKVPYANISVSSTHTHTGPLFNNTYELMVADRISEAVEKAFGNLQEVTIKSGKGTEEHISFQRRYMMKDGTVKFNPGILNPEIVRPMGPIDPEIGILYLERTDQKPLAVLVNFALHLDTAGGTEISADFPMYLQQQIGKAIGEDVLVLFGLGTCGNVNHINVKEASTLNGFARTESIGNTLAADVIKAIPAMKVQRIKKITVKREELKLTIPEYTTAQINAARINAKKVSTHGSSTPEIREAMKILRVHDRQGKPIDAEVQVFGLGDVGIVTLPGEIFVELGLAIKKGSSFPNTFIFTLSNNSTGYIPDAPAYAYGAYEVEVSRVVKGQGERLVESALKMIHEIRK
ncbi:hypothetical protein DYBT9275_02473 [Dyadobacter sp. CECT 9275]|uniref:Neutral/alkaline non-lysosomal ceramidase N-terminal domain-containing protein n=1 Tax=Dyadobacter helix TaxID=2822344 RepID=A0A916JCP5_9BACT|nr:neutral/alkaline non-lysosomal ceramidase N-terminal domain-containing protein [Dyadobacter sp. CECT 9275]CAG5000485.1 hypothetical protein DYBT9275_02473 [Dyadobacter sp. CECT 9275]